MIYLQILVNGLVLGGLYACIAVGFSLVWGVLNVINILHGSLIVLGVLYRLLRLCTSSAFIPSCRVVLAALLLFALGYVMQVGVINRVIAAPVLITLTLTFGLDLILNNAMMVAFTADYRKVNLASPLGIARARRRSFLPVDRLLGMALALLLTLLLYWLLRDTRIGRAIVAVRMDREAAALMGVDVKRIYAITFGIGALMAGAAGALLSHHLPDLAAQQPRCFSARPSWSACSAASAACRARWSAASCSASSRASAAFWFGPEHAVTIVVRLLLLLLFVRPTGLLGRQGLRMRTRGSIARRRRSPCWSPLLAAARQQLRRCGSRPSCACMRRWRCRGISSAGLPAIRRSRPRPSSASAPMLGAVLQSKRRADGRSPGASPALVGALFAGVHRRRHPAPARPLLCDRAWSIAEVLREIVNTHARSHRRRHGPQPAVLSCRSTTQAQLFFCAMLALASLRPSRPRSSCTRSRLGFGLRCIQQNEDAANMLGVNATRYKTRGLHAVGDVLSASPARSMRPGSSYIDPTDVFDILMSVKPLVMVLLGGARHRARPGRRRGRAVHASKNWSGATSSTIHAAVLGVIIVLLVLFLPTACWRCVPRRGARAARGGAAA